MRIVRTAVAASLIVPLAGCFQASTVVRVKTDGSGTIEQRVLVTDQAIDQLRAFAILGGGTAESADPTSEAQAKALATALGPGVTYVSSMPVKGDRAQGREALYAFSDITKLRISEQPSVPGGTLRAPGIGAGSEPITFALTRTAEGNSVLHILVPRPPVLPFGGPDGAVGVSTPSAAEIEMVKQLLAGARVTVAVEPEGRLVQTSSPYVDGSRVVLLDLDIDQATRDPNLLQKLQAPKTLDEAKTAIASVPGLKITLDPEITIEFAPR